MQKLRKCSLALAPVVGLTILSAAPIVHAADPEPAAKTEPNGMAPSAGTKDTTDKPATTQPSSPSTAPESGKTETSTPATGDTDQPVEDSGVERKDGVKIQELLDEGFEIKATQLVTADIVTRQLGTAAPDAVIVTLQKGSAIANCYYTLKSFVKLRLTDIKNCTVFR
jgi:hypothetical protein